MTPETWQQLKSLFHSALELAPEDRAAFLAAACDGDGELRTRVERLLASHVEAGPFLVSSALVDAGVIAAEDPVRTAAKDGRVGQRIGPYEIIREIGHGGMGTVFLAVRADDQYRKQVAIKLVNRGMDTDIILRRFMMERQILANLEHPNIARLLEGGSTTDGLPYFVMEYVEGRPIDEYCDAQRFTIAERLEVFRLVCGALQYAHQNLVVHRDIKPSNILVTPEGVPKLLDFGIAKLLSPSEAGEVTASMVQLMTPAYASPEQLRGLAITTATDVYSLGVVLYELLSGHHPHRLVSRQPEEAAQLILREEPERPSAAGSRPKAEGGSNRTDDNEQRATGLLTEETNPQSAIRNPKLLRGDLDNIALKALRKEPARRYASVQEFSEDIRRHLEGLPVTASPDTFGYRAGKFTQRHKAGVLAAAMVIITLLSATAITTWQARVARRERDKAERRFNQVRKLANSVLFEYHDGIEKLAGSTPIREKMVKDALEYLDNLSAEVGGDPALQGELAAAYEKVGDVQGNPYEANLGNQDGALSSYRKALAIRETQYAATPSDPNKKYDLGHVCNNLGDILWAKGENQEALLNYRKALAAFESLSKADAKNPRYLRGIIVSLSGLAAIQVQDGDFKNALETYGRNLLSAEDLLALEPTKNIYQRDVAVVHLNTGDALLGVSDYKGALESYEKAVKTFSAVALSDRTNADVIRELGLCYARIATAYMHLNRFEEAVQFHLKAIAQQGQVAAADPDNVQIHFDLGDTYRDLSDTYLRMKSLNNAGTSAREAIRIFRETFSRNPNYSEGQGSLGRTYQVYAEVLLARGDANGAVENYRKALTILEREPVRSAQTVALAHAYAGLGDVYVLRANQARGQTAQQAEYFKEGRDWLQKSWDVWRTLDQQGKGTDEDKTTSTKITQKIEQCNAALAKLMAGTH